MGSRVIVGIDPGTSGAIAVYHCGCQLHDPAAAHLYDMPTVKAKRGKAALDVDVKGLREILRRWQPDLVVVEQVQSRPRQAGQFAFGTNYGRILGCVEAMQLSLVHVSAQAWKQALQLRGADKTQSVLLAATLFPGAKDRLYGPRGAALDGRAEALLLAFYGAKL